MFHMRRTDRISSLWGKVRRKLLRFAAVGGVALHLAASTAWAQRAGTVREEKGALLCWGIAAGLAIVVCAAAFVNAKRTAPPSAKP